MWPALALLLVTVLTACTSVPVGQSPGASADPTHGDSDQPTPGLPDHPPLDGRQFLSVSVTVDGADLPLVAGTRIRLTFADHQIGATASCNHIGGAYRIEGDRLLVGDLSTTEMGCDPARHAQDQWLGELLGSQPQVQLGGAELVLESGTTRLVLHDVEVAEPDRPLIGPVWIVEGLIRGESVSSVPAGVVASLEFAADGTVRVAAGCNRGGGQVLVEEDALTFGGISLTRMACPGPAMEVEAIVLAVLQAGRVGCTIDGQVLHLRAGEVGLDLRAGTGEPAG